MCVRITAISGEDAPSQRKPEGSRTPGPGRLRAGSVPSRGPAGCSGRPPPLPPKSSPPRFPLITRWGQALSVLQPEADLSPQRGDRAAELSCIVLWDSEVSTGLGLGESYNFKSTFCECESSIR